MVKLRAGVNVSGHHPPIPRHGRFKEMTASNDFSAMNDKCVERLSQRGEQIKGH